MHPSFPAFPITVNKLETPLAAIQQPQHRDKEVKFMEIRNFSTDVVIIGGGGAALRAAIEASEKAGM